MQIRIILESEQDRIAENPKHESFIFKTRWIHIKL